MFIRKTLLSIALLGAVAAPAFAAGAAGYVSARGEAIYSGPPPGSTTYQTPSANATAGSTLTREAVKKELQAFRRNPVTADGYRYVGGEIGYVFVDRPAAQELSAGEPAVVTMPTVTVAPTYVRPPNTVLGAGPATTTTDPSLLNSDGDGYNDSVDWYPYDSRWH